jgi:hypothetical protein
VSLLKPSRSIYSVILSSNNSGCYLFLPYLLPLSMGAMRLYFLKKSTTRYTSLVSTRSYLAMILGFIWQMKYDSSICLRLDSILISLFFMPSMGGWSYVFLASYRVPAIIFCLMASYLSESKFLNSAVSSILMGLLLSRNSSFSYRLLSSYALKMLIRVSSSSKWSRSKYLLTSLPVYVRGSLIMSPPVGIGVNEE